MSAPFYAQRVHAHPTRMGAPRSTSSIRLLVVHTSEGGELPTSAEGLALFIASPRSASNLASYHAIADHERVIPSVPDDRVAYAAAGANNDGLHICHPGKAGQTAAQWADASSSAQLEQVALWLADKADEYSIPLRKLNAGDVAADLDGVCGHHDVSLAYRRSTHTDPGPHYPWKAVLQRAVELSTPTTSPIEEDDMRVKCVNRNGKFWLYDKINKTAVAYPGPTNPDGSGTQAGDLRLIAHLRSLKADGVIFQPHDYNGMPVPVVLDDWDLATFDAAPTGK